MKQLTAPEIRRLIKAHNTLTKITVPKGSKKADLVKLIEDAGFKLDHENKKIIKVRKGKQDISEGTEIKVPAPPPKKTKEEKEKAKKTAAEKKAQARIKTLTDADKQVEALKKLREARMKKKQDLKRVIPKAPPTPAPSKPSKPVKVKTIGLTIEEVRKNLKKGEPPSKEVIKQIKDMNLAEVIEDYKKKSAIDYFVPFVGSKGMSRFYMLYTLMNNDSDCSVSKELLIKFFENEGGSQKVMKTNLNEIVDSIIRCRKRDKMLALNIKRKGHANMLIFNHKRNEVERFEPHGYTRQKAGTDKDNLGLSPAIAEINKELKKKGESYQYKYMKPKQISRSTITKRGDWEEYEGFQYHDRGSGGAKRTIGNVVIVEAEGYCVAWSYFYLDLRLKFPKLTGEEIIDKTYEIVDNQKGQQKLKYMVRGMTESAYKWAGNLVPKYLSQEELIRGMSKVEGETNKWKKFAKAIDKYFTDTGLYAKLAT